jgi:hypothetical protein
LILDWIGGVVWKNLLLKKMKVKVPIEGNSRGEIGLMAIDAYKQ